MPDAATLLRSPCHGAAALLRPPEIASLAPERTVSARQDFEQQAVRESDRSTFGSGLDRWQNVMSIMQRSRFDVVVNFIRHVEGEIASLQQPQVMRGHLQTRYRAGDALALVNDQEIEETSARRGSRALTAEHFPLVLLGHRFVVLAGRPHSCRDSSHKVPRPVPLVRHAVKRSA